MHAHDCVYILYVVVYIDACEEKEVFWELVRQNNNTNETPDWGLGLRKWQQIEGKRQMPTACNLFCCTSKHNVLFPLEG